MFSEPDTQEAKLYTQSRALRDIISWSTDRPDWQRDALRQLVSGTTADEIDLDRLEAICVGERNDLRLLSETDVTTQGTDGEAVTLAKMHSVQGVNALAPDQKMEFSSTGVTIVYGDNGSGKSGYCRVLKHACRTRDSNFQIHPNIDDDNEINQSCHIDYRIGTTPEVAIWSPCADPIPPLAQVSIFDSRSANTHVEAENSVAYTPFPMHVLEQLGNLCDHLKARIEERIRQIEGRTPQALSNPQRIAGTVAGDFLGGLSAESDLNELALLCEITDEEQQQLETLSADLSQDPQRVISSLKAKKQRIDVIVRKVQSLEISLSEESIGGQNLVEAYSDAKSGRLGI